jgi:Ser/Thr protein kinase RdoA (MazF antagonist)
MNIGKPIAWGSRSSIHEFGPSLVVKVPYPSTPESWVRFEFAYAQHLFAVGAPIPRVMHIETIDGREAIVSERVDGPTMWDALVDTPHNAASFGVQLAELHHQLFALPAPISLPTQRTRLTAKITSAARTIDSALSRALVLIPQHTQPMSLCHGDFHPKNVILSRNGMVVVDWFDVSRGLACGDVARTLILLSSAKRTHENTDHLPGASVEVLDTLRESYTHRIRTLLTLCDEELHRWQLIEAAARLAEGVSPEPLIALLADL